MRGRILPLLLIASVAMNVAVLGTWAFRALGTPSPGVETYTGEVWCPLHRRLGVTEDQWRRIEPLMKEFRRRSQAICTDLNRLRGELIDLIAAEEPDPAAIAAKQEEIRAGQKRMQGLVVEHLLAEKDVLDAGQQRELFVLIRQRIVCHGPGRMMGLPGSD